MDTVKQRVIEEWKNINSKAYQVSLKNIYFCLPPDLQKQCKPKDVKDWIREDDDFKLKQSHETMSHGINRIMKKKPLENKHILAMNKTNAINHRQKHGANLFTICAENNIN